MIKRPILEGQSPSRGRTSNMHHNKRTSPTAEDSRKDVDESMDPIGYQAIVLDPNPKAVCQLLGIYKKVFLDDTLHQIRNFNYHFQLIYNG